MCVHGPTDSYKLACNLQIAWTLAAPASALPVLDTRTCHGRPLLISQTATVITISSFVFACRGYVYTTWLPRVEQAEDTRRTSGYTRPFDSCCLAGRILSRGKQQKIVQTNPPSPLSSANAQFPVLFELDECRNDS